MSFAGSLLLVGALALASLLAGRLVVGGFGADLLRCFDPVGAAGSLVLGAAVLTLLSIGLSAAGFPTPTLVALVPAVLLVPLALAWRRRRLDALRPRGPARAWLALLVPVAATAGVALLPVLRTNGFAIGNDTYTYCAFSEWLQHHGFSEPCRLDPFSPVTGIPWLWQRLHYDLGIAHLLALVQAAAGASVSLLVYPATAAFGMVAVDAALFLAGRSVLRLGSAWAGGTTLVFAVVPHALYWGHHNGFLQQTYALAVVLLGVVLLARSARPPRLLAGNAVLVAVPFVFLLAVYLPLLPALGLVGALALVQGFRRARRRGAERRFAAWAGGVAALFVLLGLRDLVGVVLRMRGFMTDVAGGYVPLAAVEFFQFALGARVFAPARRASSRGPGRRSTARWRLSPSASPSTASAWPCAGSAAGGSARSPPSSASRSCTTPSPWRTPGSTGSATPGTCSSCASGPTPSPCCWPPWACARSSEGRARGCGSSCRAWRSSLPSASLLFTGRGASSWGSRCGRCSPVPGPWRSSRP